MRKFLIIFTALIITTLAYLGYAHFSGGAVPTLGLPLGGEKKRIREQTTAFFENLKFKNISGIKYLLGPDVTPAELDHFVSKTFGINLHKVDLLTMTIEQIELDSKEMRARVRLRINGQDLEDKKPIEISKIIFLYRTSDDTWRIDTQSAAF